MAASGKEPIKREIIEEVVRLYEDEGLSYRQIGKRLGYSHGHVARIYRKGRPKSSGPKMLTLKQRKLAAALAEEGTVSKAAKAAGVSVNYAHRQMSEPKVVETFKALLERKGLSEEALAEKHAQLLDATKMTEWGEQPDNSVRERALSSAWKLHGRGIGEPDKTAERPTKIVIMASMADNFAALCGGKLPEEFVEIAHDEESAASLPAGDDAGDEQAMGSDLEQEAPQVRRSVEQVERDTGAGVSVES